MRGGERVFRQAMVGVVCFGLNLLLMWWLISVVHLHLLIATTICFFTLNALGHHLSRKFVFTGAGNAYGRSLLRFIFVMAASLALNLAAMSLATLWLNLPYLAASVLIAAVFFAANFLAHRDWTFAK